MDEIHSWCMRNKLKVHPGKCEAMFMMRSPFVGPLRPIMYGEDHIKIVQETTCLGLRIDNRLDWKSQVQNVCKKISKKLGALKRMKCLSTKVLDEIYNTTIIATTTYCISVWGNCSEATFNMIEDSHARAARLLHNLPRNLSNEESLARVNWQAISYLYKRRLLILMHQVYHGTADKSIAQVFQKKDPEKQRTRNKMQFEGKRYNTKTGRNSFTYKAAMIWNSIPDQIEEAENTQTFKTRLKTVRQTINNFTFQKGLTRFLNREKDFK